MSAITFRNTEAAATAILRDDKKKLVWSKMPFSVMPADIANLAAQAVELELAAREAKATLQAALDDKVEAPSGKRLVVTLGRDVSDRTDSVLVSWAPIGTSATRVISFDQFVKG